MTKWFIHHFEQWCHINDGKKYHLYIPLMDNGKFTFFKRQFIISYYYHFYSTLSFHYFLWNHFKPIFSFSSVRITPQDTYMIFIAIIRLHTFLFPSYHVSQIYLKNNYINPKCKKILDHYLNFVCAFEKWSIQERRTTQHLMKDDYGEHIFSCTGCDYYGNTVQNITHEWMYLNF